MNRETTLMNIFDYANKYLKQGDYINAKKIYKSLLNKITNKLIYFNLGVCLYECKQYNEAITQYKKVIELDSNNPNTYINLGVCLHNLEKYDEAIIQYKKAIDLDSDYKDAYKNLGYSLLKSEQYNDAIKAYEKFIILDPNCKKVYNNMGICFKNLKQYDNAIIHYHKTIELDKNFIEVYYNLGICLNYLNKYNDAIIAYEKSVQLNPFFYNSYYNLGLLYLRLKIFNKGFEYNEYRLITKFVNVQTTDYTNFPNLKLWNGTEKIYKKLLIIMEQGIGDMFQFSRYILDLLNKYPNLYIDYLIPHKIHNLINFRNIERIKVIDEIKNYKHYDYKLWLMSIPNILKINNIIPYNIDNSYIKINYNKVIEWNVKLQKYTRKKVAIFWKGNINILDIDKHIPLKLFNKISKLNVDIISLQKGDGEEELNNIDFKIHSFDIDNVNAFEDTIAIIKNVDLVITVDTSIVHLAGLLGVKTWLVLGFMSDWRWFQDEKKTDWYESVELFRSKIIDDWTEVLEEVENKLKTELKNEINNKIPNKINNKMHNTTPYELTNKEITIPKIPISIGELFDKFSILDIKMEKIKEPEKLIHVKTELEYLKPYLRKYDITEELYTNLKNVNKSLWDIEDKLRIKEKNKEFDDGFIKLSRSVYFTNDKRSEIKKNINIFFNSNIVEVKEYTDYK